MAREIERKFLVGGEGWRPRVTSEARIRQAYLALTERAAIRVRIVDEVRAFLTIKSAEAGIARGEFEYPIPPEDAEALLQLRSGLLIEKRRHIVPVGMSRWEVDVFEGAHAGLVLAEIELPDEAASFDRPDWLGAEVTGDRRYSNARLALFGLEGEAS